MSPPYIAMWHMMLAPLVLAIMLTNMPLPPPQFEVSQNHHLYGIICLCFMQYFLKIIYILKGGHRARPYIFYIPSFAFIIISLHEYNKFFSSFVINASFIMCIPPF